MKLVKAQPNHKLESTPAREDSRIIHRFVRATDSPQATTLSVGA